MNKKPVKFLEKTGKLFGKVANAIPNMVKKTYGSGGYAEQRAKKIKDKGFGEYILEDMGIKTGAKAGKSLYDTLNKPIFPEKKKVKTINSEPKINEDEKPLYRKFETLPYVKKSK